MNKNSNTYVVLFAASVCVVLAAGLAATFHGLKTRIDSNKLFDKQRNVLIACGLYDPTAGEKSRADLEAMFTKVQPKVLEFFKSEVPEEYRERGELKKRKVNKVTRAEDSGIKLEDLEKERRKNPDRILGEIYIAEDGGKKIYCIPISGYGLWSWLYGFLALEEDRNTVRGITFYKHGETPGLGGEVDKAWWQNNWKGKKTHDSSGKLVSITVLKGQGNEFAPDGHKVDGISGATITSNGVTKFVKADLEKYEAYFKGVN
jgi:Na+-transporting NADH:ubiquinone oxidoreductase subunit C